MSTYLTSKARTAVVFVALMAILAMTVLSAGANVRLDDGGDVPFYARLERYGFVSDGEWVAVFFYRPPGCVRPEFNLLDFFDVPRLFVAVAFRFANGVPPTCRQDVRNAVDYHINRSQTSHPSEPKRHWCKS